MQFTKYMIFILHVKRFKRKKETNLFFLELGYSDIVFLVSFN